MLDQARAQARLPAEIRAALEGYRSCVRLLESGNRRAYRPGALEMARAQIERLSVPPSLGGSLTVLDELFRQCGDIAYRGLLVGGVRPAALVSAAGISKPERIEQAVLDPLTRLTDQGSLPTDGDWSAEGVVAAAGVTPVRSFGDLVGAVLDGDAVLLTDGVPGGWRLSAAGSERRAVTEPQAEPVIRGPREGFTESIDVNLSLIRRRIKTPHLKVEGLVIGRRSQSRVAILSLCDVANPAVVAEVRRRLSEISTDGVLDSGNLEELIEDQPFSPFPQVASTERPDRVASGLLQGRVAVLTDGSPFALILPTSFWSLMQASEDYYERFWFGSFVRWLRYGFLIMALLSPSVYVAVTTFHQEMLPTALLISIAAAREGIPFPALIEALLMEFFFEALREAGVRLPRPVGQAVSIVGALVIGQAAVAAGLASAPVVIIVAATGIASFTIPRFNLGITMRLLRFPLMLLSGTLGLFGTVVGLVAILLHLCALRSFGVPYLSPISPLLPGGLKDVLARAPIWAMRKRPPDLYPVNPNAQPQEARGLPPGSKP